MRGFENNPKSAARRGKLSTGLSTLAAAAVLSMMPAQEAQAFCGVCAPVMQQIAMTEQVLMQAIQQSTMSIIQAVETSTYNIINAIDGSTQSIKGVNEKAINSEKELTQGRLNYDASRNMADVYAKAQEQFTVPEAQAFKTCELLAQAQQTGSAGDNARVMAKTMTTAQNRRNLYTVDAPAAAKAVLDDYKTNYCSAADQERGRCTAVGNVLMQGAATRADTLLTPAANYTYSAEESAAAAAFITMATNPVPAETLPKALEQSPAGERFILEQMNASAQLSVAQHSLWQIKSAKDAPTSPNGNANAAGYSGALSLVGLMKKFSDDKFGNPQYDVKLSGMNENGLLRELNLQTAYSNWVDYQTYLQNDRIEALLATQLAASARERSERQLAMARAMVGRSR